MVRFKRLSILLVLGTWSACSGVRDSAIHAPVRALFRLGEPQGPEDAFSLPWPNDARRTRDGKVDFSFLPLGGNPLLQDYVEAFQGKLDGFATQGAVYFRFTGPVDERSLPQDPGESLEPGATCYLVDIDRESPDRGHRIPVLLSFQDEMAIVGDNVLAMLPVPGFPLRPKTTYAAVVTTGLVGRDGRPVLAGRDMDRALSDEPPTSDAYAAWEAYEPLRRACRDGVLDCSRLASVAVFTTQDPVSFMAALREAVSRDLPDPPEPESFSEVGDLGSCVVYEGTYPTPNYQNGEPPYKTVPEGEILTDEQGRPLLYKVEQIRFALSVPKGPIPRRGWPVVLYAHGTGGDYLTFVRAGVAENLARVVWHGRVAKFAVVGIDQVLHGTRCGESGCDSELAFFNVNNPLADRDNVRQAATDDFQLVRFVEHLHLPGAGPDGRDIFFDSSNIYFMGHSQGGITGPPFLAYEPAIRAAVLSGAAGNMILALNLKTAPMDIPALITLVFGLDRMDVFQFPLTLVQTMIEAADPINYARLLTREPPPGRDVLSIFQSYGLDDTYAPSDQIEAFGVAMGLTWAEPFVTSLETFALVGQRHPTPRPLAGTLDQGRATGVFVQYVPPVGSDGHFVLFDVPDAKRDYANFLASALYGMPVLE